MPAIEELKLHSSGKVREIYEAGEQELIMVASDRISAFDVVLSPGIPDVVWIRRRGPNLRVIEGLKPARGAGFHREPIVSNIVES